MAFTGQIGAANSKLGNIVLGLGAITPAPPPVPWYGYQDATAEQTRAARWHRNRTNRLAAFGLLDSDSPLPVPPTFFGFQDPTAEQVRAARWHRNRTNRLAALGYLDGFEVLPLATAAAPTTAPNDPGQLHPAFYRRRQRRLKRRRLIEALLLQHRFGVDVVDPFLVARTVRSMLAAGTWEPGGF